jgi:hypothetical protein
MDYLVLVILASASLNIFLGFKLWRKDKEPVVTKDAQILLSEILSGPTVVKIEVMNPANLFMRSPRG